MEEHQSHLVLRARRVLKGRKAAWLVISTNYKCLTSLPRATEQSCPDTHEEHLPLHKYLKTENCTARAAQIASLLWLLPFCRSKYSLNLRRMDCFSSFLRFSGFQCIPTTVFSDLTFPKLVTAKDSFALIKCENLRGLPSAPRFWSLKENTWSCRC